MKRLLIGYIVCFITILITPASVYAQTTIAINPSVIYQTMTGWEAVQQSGQVDCSIGFNVYKNQLFDQASQDLNINRLRIEVKAISDTSTQFFLFDSKNPNAENNSLKDKMDRVVIPYRQKMQALGKKLWLNFIFVGKSGFISQPDMQVYANEVLRTYQFVQSNYGILPDSWEIVLEPGYVSPSWNGSRIADATTRTSAILRQNGYTPYLILPSSSCGLNTAIGMFNNVLSANGGNKPADMREFAYHRYCTPASSDFTQLKSIMNTHNVASSMLEKGGASYIQLHQDLKVGNVSAWEQFTLAYCYQSDNGYQYYLTTNSSSPSITVGTRTKYLQQYFKHVDIDAKRIDATLPGCNSQTECSGSADPLAFKNPNGRMVVIIKVTSTPQTFTLSGLNPGTYGSSYTNGSASTQWDVEQSEVIVSSNGVGSFTIPSFGSGVLTVYQKTSSGDPKVDPPTPTPTAGPINRPTSTLTPTPTLKPGDANGDNKVDGVDYVVWLNNYNTSNSGPSNGDFNNDNKVDGVDYVVWLNHYGT